MDYVSYLFLKFFYIFLRFLGLNGARRVGENLTMLWFYLDKRRRKIALNNASFALDIPVREARKIVKRNYHHYGKIIGEIVYWKKIYRNWENFFRFENLEYLDELKKSDKGFIILTGHIGNWEIASIGFVKKIGRGAAIVKPINNRYIDNFITSIREEIGIDLITGKNQVFEMMKRIRKGENLVFLLDQNAPAREAVFVDFFGKPASTFKVVALLSLKFNIPVLPAYCVRRDDAKFLVRLESPIFPIKSGNLDKDVIKNTQKYTTFLENVIKKYPEQWFWVHNRWKTQPEKPDEEKQSNLHG